MSTENLHRNRGGCLGGSAPVTTIASGGVPAPSGSGRSVRRFGSPLAAGARRTRALMLDEACAVVNGRAAELYRSGGQQPPCWTWLNALGHGSPARIREWAVAHPESVWADASLEVAAELERLEPGLAAAVQSTVFVPAELAALGADDATGGAVMRAVSAGVAAALRHPSGREP
jgi:hypothetical protein